MKIILRIFGGLLIVTFVIFAFMGVNNNVPREFVAIPFGLVFVTLALEVLVSRRNIISLRGGTELVGTPGWKFSLICFLIVGAFTTFMGTYFVLMHAPIFVRNIILLIAIVSLLVSIVLILRVERVRISAGDPSEIIKNSEIYFAYGRKAQAIFVLEKALRYFPKQTDIEQKLHEIKGRNDIPMPILLRSLAIGVIAASIFSVAGFLVLQGTWVHEIFNWPLEFIVSILGYLIPSTVIATFAQETSGPANSSIFIWIVIFTAIHFFWSRYLK